MNAAESLKAVDVVGVGINATDTIIRLPHFPALDSKVEIISTETMPGGQVASAVVACRRWGLAVRYVGRIGEDAAAQLQIEEMKRERVDAHWIVAPGCASQTAFILVDESSGERTVLWKRDSTIALTPEHLKREWISGARVLLIDGHDTAAAAKAARWAKEGARGNIAPLAEIEKLRRTGKRSEVAYSPERLDSAARAAIAAARAGQSVGRGSHQ